MGRLDVSAARDPSGVRAFTKAVLRDLDTLDRMLAAGAIESGVRRLGVEQEMFLVGPGWWPAPRSIEILDGLARPEFTTELARFNMELNLPPISLAGSCFDELRTQLHSSLEAARVEAAKHGAAVVLTGVLPTLRKSDLNTKNITPRDRYYMLNETMTRLRGGTYRLHIQGADELNLEHDSVMLESCNTSFQVHLQVDPDEFSNVYNAAQAVTAPVLAACVNSPLLFGRRLWSETRIALFQQSIDTRRITADLRTFTPRVRFGERWVERSVSEVFQEDVSRFPALMQGPALTDSLEVFRRGEVPKLDALQFFNGTVYRWNRPCYGVYQGKPHLRIECRVLPAGPSIIDEVANTALWVGSVLGLAAEYENVSGHLNFDDVRANLLAAARRGLDAGFTWIGGESLSAPTLVLDKLLPLAEAGLAGCGVDAGDITRYLDVIHARVGRRATGAWWLRASLAGMNSEGTPAERMAALTAATARRQWEGKPVHEWALASIEEGGGWRHHYRTVEQLMTTELFTVKEDELLDLAALIMDWKHIRQIPVEDDDRGLVGLVSYRAVLRHLVSDPEGCAGKCVAVRDVMERDPATVAPDTSIEEAIQRMRENRVTSLPVLFGEKLVGIITVDDFLPLVERALHEPDPKISDDVQQKGGPD